MNAAAIVQGAGMLARASLSQFPVGRKGLRVLINGALYYTKQSERVTPFSGS